MPRVARVKTSSAGLYHITERGNERRDIFHDDEDRIQFLGIVKRNQIKYGFKVYAYCLMTNHLHLLLACDASDISQVMKSINVSYVSYFNRKYDRCGHLFQDRFRSDLVDTNEYAMEVSRYIHLNPMRAGLVSSERMCDYPWSSYRQYLHTEAGGSLLVDTDFILDLFSDDPTSRNVKYQEYVMRDEETDEYQGAGGYCTNRFRGASLQVDEYTDPIITQEPKDILQTIATHCGIEIETIRDQWDSQVSQRNQMIRETRRQTKLTLKEIGQLFGGISESMVSKILKGDGS